MQFLHPLQAFGTLFVPLGPPASMRLLTCLGEKGLRKRDWPIIELQVYLQLNIVWEAPKFYAGRESSECLLLAEMLCN